MIENLGNLVVVVAVIAVVVVFPLRRSVLTIVVDELDGVPAFQVIVRADAGCLRVGTSGILGLAFPVFVAVVAFVGRVVPALVVVVDGMTASTVLVFVAVSL